MGEYLLISNIVKFWLALLFGKRSLDGYYSSTEEDKSEKRYIFASVFPNEEVMELALSEHVSEVSQQQVNRNS